MTCPKCGDPKGKHFVPPSLGEPGFYICEQRRLAAQWFAQDVERRTKDRAALDIQTKEAADAQSDVEVLRDALIVVANVGSGEAKRVALEALRKVDGTDG